MYPSRPPAASPASWCTARNGNAGGHPAEHTMPDKTPAWYFKDVPNRIPADHAKAPPPPSLPPFLVVQALVTGTQPLGPSICHGNRGHVHVKSGLALGANICLAEGLKQLPLLLILKRQGAGSPDLFCKRVQCANNGGTENGCPWFCVIYPCQALC